MKWKDRKRNDIIFESEIIFGKFKLSVHHYMGCGDIWFASCSYLFSKRELDSENLEEAKCQAIAQLRFILKNALEDME